MTSKEYFSQSKHHGLSVEEHKELCGLEYKFILVLRLCAEVKREVQDHGFCPYMKTYGVYWVYTGLSRSPGCAPQVISPMRAHSGTLHACQTAC